MTCQHTIYASGRAFPLYRPSGLKKSSAECGTDCQHKLKRKYKVGLDPGRRREQISIIMKYPSLQAIGEHVTWDYPVTQVQKLAQRIMSWIK